MHEYFLQCQSQINLHLSMCLPGADQTPSRLHEAMRYCVIDGGKRIRPLLTLATAEVCGAETTRALPAACALELIHAYSLIHDDLPAMDDDDLRRGKPTCHKAYDEATAILAGDALQALAFEQLAIGGDYDDAARIQMIRELSKASGSLGMVGGQAIDLAAVGKSLTLSELEQMHNGKTGALIEASVVIGALAGGETRQDVLATLRHFAKTIGLAFQVQDDILDITSDTQTLGKPQGSDIERNKPTYPALLGLEGAQSKADQLYQESMKALSQLPFNTDKLNAIAAYIVKRQH